MIKLIQRFYLFTYFVNIIERKDVFTTVILKF